MRNEIRGSRCLALATDSEEYQLLNTPSHFLMTMVAGKCSRVRPPKFALALGSVAPDLALYFLSLGGIYYYTQVEGWETSRTFRHLFGELFYQHPGWIIPHNLLHAPFLLLLLLGIAAIGMRLKIRTARWFCWFFSACLLHSIVDIVTHNDDGPLMFFPADWTYRFTSPVSYWDPDHFGRPFSFFEIGLDVFLLLLLFRWRKKTLVEP